MSTVFIIPFRVKSTESSIMPKNANRASVSCYAKADEFEVAAKACMNALANDGLEVDDILKPVHALQQSQWAQHISVQWPDHVSDLPTQTEFDEKMNSGAVVYGPFGTY